MTVSQTPNIEIELPIPFRKKAERATGRLMLRLLVGPIRAVPWEWARRIGRGIGAFAFYLLKKQRRISRKNLALVYSDKTDVERTLMAKAMFRHFGEMAAEFVKMPRLTREGVDGLCDVEGEENLREALAMGRGVLLITGHFGNWEFMARWLAIHGYPINVVARNARDPEATKFMADTRTGSGAQVFFRGNSARAVLQCLKKAEIVALLPDQNAADVFVPFMGFSTGTVDGPAVIHLRTGAPLLFSWCVRTPDNRFRICYDPPVVVPTTGDQSADVHAVMALVNARLEARIREYPTQWLWLHDRWKASPDVFPDGAENARILKMAGNRYLEETRSRDGRNKTSGS